MKLRWVFRPDDDANCEVTRGATPVSFRRFAYLSTFSLSLTCVGCVEIENSSFIPFGTMEDYTWARASP